MAMEKICDYCDEKAEFEKDNEMTCFDCLLDNLCEDDIIKLGYRKV